MDYDFSKLDNIKKVKEPTMKLKDIFQLGKGKGGKPKGGKSKPKKTK